MSVTRAAWIDGALVDPSQPQLNVDDHGVLTGDGVFETLLVVPDGSGVTAFALGRHLERLAASASRLLLECPYSDDEIRSAVAECLARAPDAGVVRITLTSGGGPIGSRRGDRPGTTIVMAGGNAPDYTPGTSVAVVPFRRNEHGAMAGVKTTSHAENVVALRYAQDRGATEAIFADTQDRVCEGTGSNIFWSDGTRILTPSLDTGCLAGVTRALILELVDVVETHLPVAELASVPEAFLASTTRVIQSIGRVDERDLAVVDGPLITAATEAMRSLIATNVDP